jgi:hypothetical protein
MPHSALPLGNPLPDEWSLLPFVLGPKDQGALCAYNGVCGYTGRPVLRPHSLANFANAEPLGDIAPLKRR